MPKPLQDKTTRQHVFMVAGELVIDIDGNEGPTAVRSNAIVKSPDGRFSVLQIGQAQMALQLAIQKKMEGINYTVLDVTILSLMNLGLFSDEEFHQTPAGTELKARTSESPVGHA